MRIRRLDPLNLLFSEIGRSEVEFLFAIPTAADPTGSPEAEARLFSVPTDEPDRQFVHDWCEYVQPELRELFAGAVESVRQDLAHLRRVPPPEAGAAEESGACFTLPVPLAHLEQWMNALNQASLALAARHHLDQSETISEDPATFPVRQQIRFYQVLLDYIVECLEYGPPGGAAPPSP